MKPLPFGIVALALLAAPVPASAACYDYPANCPTNYYVVGNLCSTCEEFPPAEARRLFDDGLHGDGAAGDEVYGVAITVDRPAGSYVWFLGVPSDGGPHYADFIPWCWCTPPPTAVESWTSGPGDVVQIRLDLRPRTAGWQGCGLSCDHGMAPGTELEVSVDPDPVYGQPYGVFPAQRTGSIWSCVVRFSAPGSHQYVFLGQDRSVRFALNYNAPCGCFPGEERMPTFTTTAPDTDVLMQFDESTGLVRAVVGGATAVQGTSWGALKARAR